MDTYLFVADEMGNPGISSITSNTFVFGGFVLDEKYLQDAIASWRKIKIEMCGRDDVELKWKHFFVDEHDPRFTIPLKVKNKFGRRNLAALALKYLFHKSQLFPLVAISRKDRATPDFIVETKKGRKKIDYDTMWIGPIGMFATFLSLKKALGKLFFDNLNPIQEESRQKSWSNNLRQIRKKKFPDNIMKNLIKLLSIQEKIEFLDSGNNEIIQIAEFIVGVIWNAGEGDEAFLSEFENVYGTNAQKVGLGILHIA